MYLNPVAISVIIVAAVIFIGAFIAYFRDRKVYEGHGEYSADARALATKLNGEVFRDGEDLVINGTHSQLPVVIRLSFAENTPGLHIRMVAPANFRMFIVPKGARAIEGKVQVRTNDDSFDARFVTRSDNPTQAKMFLGSKGVLPELGKLGCLSKGYVTFTTGSLEMSEALVPTPNTGHHIQEHLQSMERLAKELARMPFADRVELKPLKRERRMALKVAIVAGMVAALVGIITAAQQPQEIPLPEAGTHANVTEGVMPNDAIAMGSLTDWRAAVASDLDPDAAAWARGAGQKEVGRLTANFSGANRSRPDVAYLLVNNKDGVRRIVLLSDGKNRYDVKYPSLSLLAIVPKANLARIEWASRTPETPDGDAILLVRKPQDRTSGLVLYFSDGKLVSAVPSDYQSINLLD
jgi:hypothetical protein